MRKFLIAASAALTFVQPAFAQAPDRQIGDWTLMDTGKACSLWTTNESGSAMTMFNLGEGLEGIGFIVDGLTGVVNGQVTQLQVAINGGSPLDIDAEGIIMKAGNSGYMLSFPVDVLTERPMAGQMSILRGGKAIHSFRLDGLQAPAQALVDCAKKY